MRQHWWRAGKSRGRFRAVVRGAGAAGAAGAGSGAEVGGAEALREARAAGPSGGDVAVAALVPRRRRRGNRRILLRRHGAALLATLCCRSHGRASCLSGLAGQEVREGALACLRWGMFLCTDRRSCFVHDCLHGLLRGTVLLTPAPHELQALGTPPHILQLLATPACDLQLLGKSVLPLVGHFWLVIRRCKGSGRLRRWGVLCYCRPREGGDVEATEARLLAASGHLLAKLPRRRAACRDHVAEPAPRRYSVVPAGAGADDAAEGLGRSGGHGVRIARAREAAEER
mmetsp:Transcript_64782/g.179647  ORF Transcript_64782/g.179647 Transcript_64782/m.179647 type:complete len:286 (+) Transcript_64782:206-1063(+)